MKGRDQSNNNQIEQQKEEHLPSKVAGETSIVPTLEQQRLTHELQVHQIELEMQNEDLEQSCADTEGLLEQFTDLYDFAPVGYVTLQADGEISQLNLACARMLNCERENLLHKRFAGFLVEADRIKFSDFLGQVFSDGSPGCEQFTLDTGSKSAIYVMIMAELSKERQECRAVVADITDQKQAEIHRLELEKQLRQKYKMEAVGIMAGGMAHNFNNNLSIILGNIELSQLKIAPESEIGGFLADAKIAVYRASELVKQILSYSRHNVLGKGALHLVLLVDETIKLLRATIPATINLQRQINADCDRLTVIANATQMQECLLNLCNNAMQSMDEKGDMTIALEIADLTLPDIPKQYDAQPGRYAKLSVTDTGCGMTSEVLDKAFDLFFTTKDVDQGTGVGLSTVQGIVKQHGGLIKLHSIVGQGTTFELYFPVVDDLEEVDLPDVKKDIVGGKEHILFVEDNAKLAAIGEQMLAEIGYKVTMITDSSEALQRFTVNPDYFDLVITDQTMPTLTGEEIIAQLKQLRPDIPTIMCTGFSSKIDAEKAQKLGINAFLMKPLDMLKLAQTIREVLDR